MELCLDTMEHIMYFELIFSVHICLERPGSGKGVQVASVLFSHSSSLAP